MGSSCSLEGTNDDLAPKRRAGKRKPQAKPATSEKKSRVPKRSPAVGNSSSLPVTPPTSHQATHRHIDDADDEPSTTGANGVAAMEQPVSSPVVSEDTLSATNPLAARPVTVVASTRASPPPQITSPAMFTAALPASEAEESTLSGCVSEMDASDISRRVSDDCDAKLASDFYDPLADDENRRHSSSDFSSSELAGGLIPQNIVTASRAKSPMGQPGTQLLAEKLQRRKLRALKAWLHNTGNPPFQVIPESVLENSEAIEWDDEQERRFSKV